MHGVTEKQLQEYFLGDLSEDEAFDLEIQIAKNVRLCEFARSVEIDIVDKYVAGRLPDAIAEKFRTKYLVTAKRINRCILSINLAKLRAGLDRAAGSIVQPASNWLENSLDGRKKFVSFLVGI